MNLFIHLMTTFIIVIFMNLGLISTMVLAHDGPNTDNWGYIRIDNKRDYPVYTKCYDRYGKGGSWRTTGKNHFRSCHGAYMRMDFYANRSPEDFFPTKITQRAWRNCGDKGLYLKLSDASQGSYKLRKKCQ